MGAHANDRPAEMLDYPEDPQFGKSTPGKVAMWIFLVTDAMSFAGLLIAYAVLRATKDWPNPIEALGGVDLPAFMTFLLICFSGSPPNIFSSKLSPPSQKDGILVPGIIV